MHLVNGVLGMLLLAFVARPPHVELLTNSPCGGIFYTRLGWLQLGMQALGERHLQLCWGAQAAATGCWKFLLSHVTVPVLVVVSSHDVAWCDVVHCCCVHKDPDSLRCDLSTSYSSTQALYNAYLVPAACPALLCVWSCPARNPGIALTLCLGTVFATLVFGLLRHFNLLRVDQMTELAGIDNIDHGGPAYPEFNMTQLNGMTSPHGRGEN